MKCFLLLALISVTATIAIIPEIERINGENGWYIPHVNGSFEWIDMDEAETILKKRNMLEGRLFINPVTFYLCTKNKRLEKIIPTRKSIEKSHFNAKNPTRITIHGWIDSKDNYFNKGVCEAWLSRGDYNMIVVDWARARSIIYVSSVLAIPGVGKKVAAFVDFLVKEYGLKLNTLEIIGHSLGAHVAGYTGKNIASGKAHAIIGLDPAMPLFSYNNPNKRLSSTDAHYVETIQTNGGKLGFLLPIGDLSFYPNGGTIQPGCGFDITGSCSHHRAVVYYTEAVEKNDFLSIKCSDYREAVAKKCGFQYSSVRMGAMTNAYYEVSGQFYVPVGSEAPYGKIG